MSVAEIADQSSSNIGENGNVTVKPQDRDDNDAQMSNNSSPSNRAYAEPETVQPGLSSSGAIPFPNPFMVPHMPQDETGQLLEGDKSQAGGYYPYPPQFYHELFRQYFQAFLQQQPVAGMPMHFTPGLIPQGAHGSTYPEWLSPHSAGSGAPASELDYSISRPEDVGGSVEVLPSQNVAERLAGATDLSIKSPEPQERISSDLDNGTSVPRSELTSSEASPKNTGCDELDMPSQVKNVVEASPVASDEVINTSGTATMSLIKKQIHEIEKQITQRMQNQNPVKINSHEVEDFLKQLHDTLADDQQQEFQTQESPEKSVRMPMSTGPSFYPPPGYLPRHYAPSPVLPRFAHMPFPPAPTGYPAVPPGMGGYSDFVGQPHMYGGAPAAPHMWPYSSAAPYPGMPIPGGAMPQHLQQQQPWPEHYRDTRQQAVISSTDDHEWITSTGEGSGLAHQRSHSDSGITPAAPLTRSSIAAAAAVLEKNSATNGDSEMSPAREPSADLVDGEPVWVLRESYVRKLKREEERQLEEERRANEQHRQCTEEESGPAHDSDTDTETDRLLGLQRVAGAHKFNNSNNAGAPAAKNVTSSRTAYNDDDEEEAKSREMLRNKHKSRKKEVIIHEPAVLIEGVLFRANYLGSTQLICEGRPTKATRMMQAQEAVSRIKAPEGESQPAGEVDLFISTEKIMVLNTDLQEIMMDHALRTISYIADIGDLVVLMARRMAQPAGVSGTLDSAAGIEDAIRRTPKMICHVFESDEAQFIAQSIGQAFQVAYLEFLRQNGIEDPGYLRELDYQEVLNAQQIFNDELDYFSRKDLQKDVVVPKQKGEILGMVVVESGWGSMLPTVVIANLLPTGPASRCNQLNIGDQIIAINGISLVGLPLATCQNHVRGTKPHTAVKLTVVHTPPVVEVRIKRPDTKYQLGFSVQNGVICSLLRGGIAERGGVRVGHRIIEINGQSVVAVAHEKIVTMLATAVGEIQMKTMPTSMFRLLTGQETPNYL